MPLYFPLTAAYSLYHRILHIAVLRIECLYKLEVHTTSTYGTPVEGWYASLIIAKF